MNFAGIGMGEILLIFLIALVVFGPRRLPEIGASLGKAVREFREMSQGMTEELTKELQAPLKEAQEVTRGLEEEAQDATKDLEEETEGELKEKKAE